MKPASSARDRQSFYLFTQSSGQPVLSGNSVFYKASGEQLANRLCQLFCREYSSESRRPGFFVKSADEVDPNEQVLLDEALGWLDVYSMDPDPGVCDPPPSKEEMTRANYARRARDWEGTILAQTEPSRFPVEKSDGRERLEADRPSDLRQWKADAGPSPHEKLADAVKFPTMTVTEVRALLNVSRASVYRYLNEGRLDRPGLNKRPGKRSKTLVLTSSVQRMLQLAEE
jgi:hypothetical protein